MDTTTDPVLAEYEREINEKSALLAEMERKAAETREQLERVQIAADEHRRIVALLDRAPNHAVVAAAGTVTKVAKTNNDDAVLAVFQEAGRGVGLHEKDVLARLMATGWQTDSVQPLAIVRTYLSRLKGRNLIIRTRKGTYTLAQNAAGPTEAGPVSNLRLVEKGGG